VRIGADLIIPPRFRPHHALPAVLAEEGVPIDPKREEHDYGTFAWTTDPEGNRIELWEPP
jgi:predicted enzyme related to lactoylglutathione lyase